MQWERIIPKQNKTNTREIIVACTCSVLWVCITIAVDHYVSIFPLHKEEVDRNRKITEAILRSKK